MADLDNQTEEALGWTAEGKKLAVDIPEVSLKMLLLLLLVLHLSLVTLWLLRTSMTNYRKMSLTTT